MKSDLSLTIGSDQNGGGREARASDQSDRQAPRYPVVRAGRLARRRAAAGQGCRR